MAWIKMISMEEAGGTLKAMYEKYIEPVGVVDNILRIHSLNPKSLRTDYDLYAHLMRGKSDLSRVQREMIAVVASAANKCHFGYKSGDGVLCLCQSPGRRAGGGVGGVPPRRGGVKGNK